MEVTMEKEQTSLQEIDVAMLSNELTYRKYMMDKEKIRNFFRKMSIPEYIALHHIAQNETESSIYGGRTYLKELSEKLELTMRKTSNMVGKLRDEGLVTWAHDGDGSEGTYVMITDLGKKLLQEQEEILKDYYGNVIQKFGKDNFIQLLQLMKQLETIMSSEVEEREARLEHGRQNDRICKESRGDM